MPKTKLLLVEDDNSQAALLALELRRAGFDVEPIKTGEDAIGRLSATLYDVIITDLRLGSMDGLQVLREAKRAQPEAEVLVITGHGSIDTAVEAMKHGAFDYLTKPVQPEELLLSLQKALEHRSLHLGQETLSWNFLPISELDSCESRERPEPSADACDDKVRT
jgi:DNA-binding NtrC family response regulator